MLNLTGRRALVVGGGGVAVRRARSFLEAGAAVTVVAPELDPALEALQLIRLPRRFNSGDLDGAFLVVAATDDPAVNERVATLAQEAGILVNRADRPSAGDFTVPAHARHGPITLAVHSGGISAGAAATIRRELSAHLDPHWPEFLEACAPWRGRIQRAFAADALTRRRRLAALVSTESRALWAQDAGAWQTFAAKLLDPEPTL